MRTRRLWRNPASALDFLDARVGAFLSTLELATSLSLWRLLKIVGITALAVYASMVAAALFGVDREFNSRTVIVVTATDVAVAAAILFGAIAAWSCIILICDIRSCWRKARRALIATPHVVHPHDDPDPSLDNLRAYAAARRNEALRDHHIVVDAVNTMAKEIFK